MTGVGPADPRTVLVIGTSGILGPAAAALAGRGDAVLGVSRGGRAVPPGVESLVTDAADRASLVGALEGRRWDDAVVYAPAVSDASSAELHGRTPGRFVLVRVTAAADPARGPLDIPDDTVQLGWAAGRRWHTPDEVSAAALATLDDGRPRLLGAVRPWSDRPSHR